MRLRLAAARLVATPLFSVFAVLSLAFGVAVTTAVYSVVDSLFLRDAGIAEPEKIAFVVSADAGRTVKALISAPDLSDLRAAQSSFRGLSASTSLQVSAQTPSRTEAVAIEAVDGAYFTTLGISPSIGRVLRQADDDGAARVVVLSDEWWRLRFGADPAVVGQTLRLAGQPFEIVGVAAARFAGTIGGFGGARLWTPLAAEPLLAPPRNAQGPGDTRQRRRLHVFGRLAPAATAATAAAEFASIAARLDASFPTAHTTYASRESGRSWTARTLADLDEKDDGTRRMGLIVVALVALVLLVAGTNLANLMLARGVARQRDLAVRMALGASRWRLVREECGESVLLALAGGIAAYFGFQLLQIWMSADFNLMARWTLTIRPTLDVKALSVATGALVLSLLVFGLEPAVHLARTVNLTGALAEAGGRARLRRQRMVIRWQVAVSAGFFIVATLFVRQTVALAQHDPGIDMDRLAVAMVSAEGPEWDEPRLRAAMDRVLEEGRGDHTLESVAAVTGLPIGFSPRLQLSLGRPSESGALVPASGLAATPSIFTTLGVRIVRGRGFDDRDRADAPSVAVLSELTAKRVFGTVDAVGRPLIVHRRGVADHSVTVVGIARDTDVRALLVPRTPFVYLPLTQHDEPARVAVARSTAASRAVPALRDALRRADPDLAVDLIGTASEALSGPYELLRAGGLATLYLGVATLILSMAGLFGVQSHVISHRTREIGIRMSMGATSRQIETLVLRDGYRPVMEGLALGLWGGVAGRVLARAYLDVDVDIIDSWAFLLMPVPVIAAAFCACYLPARRASSVDPVVTLRCE
jgi:putative ABC transport system permease protein